MEVVEWAVKWFLSFLLGGGIWKLFSRAEATASPEVRNALSRWLRNLDPDKTVRRWPQTFIVMFDSVFDERHLSWRCFRRSCYASLGGVSILISVLAAYQIELAITEIFEQGTWIKLLGLAIFLNPLPDYVSLLETRLILRWMTRKSSWLRIISLMGLDIILTGAIFFFGTVLVVTILTMAFKAIHMGVTADLAGIYMNPVYNMTIVWKNLMLPMFQSWLPGGETYFGIFFYSTYFTSAWLWLFMLSSCIVKFFMLIGGFLSSLCKITSI